MAKKIPAEFQKAVDLMAEGLGYLNVKGAKLETIKAGMKACATYALMKRSGFVLKKLAPGEESQRSI